MRRTTFSRWPCSVARTVDIIGDWWTPLVLRECCYGVRRFEDFQRVLGIGRNVLTQRLNRLVDEGLLERVRYCQHPPRDEYVLTTKGSDFWPVLAAIGAWGDAHLAGEEGPPLVMHHTTCDHDTTPMVVCAHCREPLAQDDVRTRFGPGYPEHVKARARALGRFDEDGDPANI
ncbi:MAG: helix-turn-helix domain-containing protein [Ilumatobacteraceae bacterium]